MPRLTKKPGFPSFSFSSKFLAAGSAAVIAWLSFNSSKQDPLQSSGLPPAEPAKGSLAVIQVPRIEDLKRTSYSLTDLQKPGATPLRGIGVTIDGQIINMACAAHLLKLKEHAAAKGHEITVVSSEVWDRALFLELQCHDNKAEQWLKNNSAGYGFRPAVDEKGQLSKGFYAFVPVNPDDIGPEILARPDRYSQVLLARTCNSPGLEISAEQFNKEATGLISSAIFPYQDQGKLRISFDSLIFNDVIFTLDSCNASTVSLVPVNKTLSHTLKQAMPGIEDTAEFPAILAMTVKLNELIFNFRPESIPAGNLVVLPVFDNPQLPGASSMKKTGDPEIKTSTNPGLNKYRKIAQMHGIIGKERIRGAITHALEAGGKDSLAIGNTQGDPGGRSYGKCQLSSLQGSLQNFIDFCLGSEKFSEIGRALRNGGGKLGKKIPDSFDQCWTATVCKNPELFKAAENAFIEKTIVQPAMARAAQHGLDTKIIPIENFTYSLGTQFGIPDPRSSPATSRHRFDQICRAAKGKSGTPEIIEALINKRNIEYRELADYHRKAGRVKAAKIFGDMPDNRGKTERALLLWQHSVTKKG